MVTGHSDQSRYRPSEGAGVDEWPALAIVGDRLSTGRIDYDG